MPFAFIFDENSLAVAKALACVRDDVTYPGAPGSPVKPGMKDLTLLPIIGQSGLVLLTRDRRIRLAPIERRKLLEHGVRACFLTSGGNLSRFDQLRLWLRHWDAIERLVLSEPAPWLASVTRNDVRLFDRRS
jgi:PIN like domain